MTTNINKCTSVLQRPIDPVTRWSSAHSATSFSSVHPASALSIIDLYVGRGLRLPTLSHLNLDGLTGYPGVHSAFHFPQLSSHLTATVTTLEFAGGSQFNFVRSWIDALGPSLDLLVAYGRGPVMIVLDALCRARHHSPNVQSCMALKSLSSVNIPRMGEILPSGSKPFGNFTTQKTDR